MSGTPQSPAKEITLDFPRPELLESMIRLLGSGSNVTLFARRRSGKTMFLREELMPALSELGWFVARVDLWRNRGNPAFVARGWRPSHTPRAGAIRSSPGP